MSKFYIIKYCQAFLAVKLPFKSHCLYAYSYFCGLKHSNPDCFSCQFTKINFWVPNAKVCVTYSINGSFSIIITNFQQKYVVLTAIRRSGGISKILLIKKLKSKVYVSFRIRLYMIKLDNNHGKKF